MITSTKIKSSEVWNHLPEEMREAAESTWPIGIVRSKEIGEARAARLPHGAIVLDPMAAADNPEIWKLVRQHLPSPAYHSWRARQVMQNDQILRVLSSQGVPGWRFERNQFAGRPAYIIGNGPSAHLARAHIPKRSDRKGLVFCVNGSAKLFDGDLDFWCLGDALWPDGRLAWRHQVLGEWGSVDYSGSHAIASIYSSAEALELYRLGGGGSTSFYHGCHENPYRPLVTEDQILPAFVEGLQAVVSHINAAWWLGCSPIILCGLDQCYRPEAESLHASGNAGWRPGLTSEWIEVTDVAGRRAQTMPDLVAAATHVAALAMWIQDVGVPVFNASEGVDYIFAPYEPAASIIEKAEKGVDENLADRVQNSSS
jgi:hypothetical protein